MAFDQSSITRVYPPEWDNGAVLLRWDSTAPAGTYFQVYVARKLVSVGRERYAWIPWPQANVRIDVGAVDAARYRTDYSSSLPSTPPDRAVLSWLGGTYLDASGNDDIAGFRVYGEATPGDGIDYTRALSDIPAYTDGIITDGWGLGGWGTGGWGRAASTYTWTSKPLTSGTRVFGIRSYDASGNEATPLVGSIAIAVPPRPPKPNTAGKRLTYSYSPTTHVLTINWIGSLDESLDIPSSGGGISLMGMI